MDTVDEAIAWFESRKGAIDSVMTESSFAEGEDNGGRAVQILFDNDRIVAGAFFWACGMGYLQAFEIETGAEFISDVFKTIDSPLSVLLDAFLERLESACR